MDALRSQSAEQQDSSPYSVKKLVPFLLLALLLHVLFLLVKTEWFQTLTPERMEVQTLTPEQVDAVRNKWQRKQFLLDKENTPEVSEPDPHSRYFSKRNTRVEREQKARRSGETPRSRTAPQANKKQALNTLGVPLHLDRGVAGTKEQPTPRSLPGTIFEEVPEGDQAIRENLPEGSENLLNSTRSIYYSFFARFYETIAPTWYSRINASAARSKVREGQSFETYVDIVLDRNGYLKELRFLKGSGLPELERSIEETFQKVTEFPHPPKDLIDERGEVHIVYSFGVNGVGTRGFLPQVYRSPGRSNPNWN